MFNKSQFIIINSSTIMQTENNSKQQIFLYGITFENQNKHLDTDDLLQANYQQLKTLLRKSNWFTKMELVQLDYDKLKQRTKTFVNAYPSWRRKRINGKNDILKEIQFEIFKTYLFQEIFFKSPGQINQQLQLLNSKLKQMCLLGIRNNCVGQNDYCWQLGFSGITSWNFNGKVCQCDCHPRKKYRLSELSDFL